MNTFHVDVVSAEESIFEGEAEFVALPGESGELGILPQHTPLITRIKPGAVRIKVPGRADGAAALVIVSEELARASGRPYVLVRGRGFEHEGLHQLADRHRDALDYASLRGAAARALAEAGLSLSDVSLFQLYAPCTIVEILATEALGLFERGRGA